MLKTFLKKLVIFKTITTDLKTNQVALNWCAREFKKNGLRTKFFESNKILSLYAAKNFSKNPKILLVAHMDVVSASPALFRLRIFGDKLVGRGVFDMKYAIACYLALTAEQKISMDKIAILITTDEEVGGKNGAGYFVKQRIVPEFCVLPDGGKDFVFERSAKGILQIKIISRGVSAHGSRPWLGVNALEKLMDFLMELKKEFPKEPCDDPGHKHNTISVTVMNSGAQTNRIPEVAEARADIRIAPGFSLNQMKARVFGLGKKYPNLEILELSSADSFVVPNTNILYKKFLQLTEKSTKRKIEYLDSPGSCDARYFLAKKIPTVVVRPKGGGHHTEQEWVSQKSLAQFYRVLKDFIEQNGN